jgi:hypothetical protein
MGVFYINFKEKKHINTRLELGDIINVHSKWKKIIKRDMLYRVQRNIMSHNIRNYYSNFIYFYFFFFRLYKHDEIKYPTNKLDLYRAIDFVGPLR